MPAGHDGHEFRLGRSREERTNAQRGLRLAHEDAGSDVQRFGAADLHGQLHQPRHALDHKLHDAQVIQHSKKRRDEDDDRQHLEGDDEPIRRVLLAQFAEDKSRAHESIREHAVDNVAGRRHGSLSAREAQYQQGENPLQAQSPGSRLPANRLTVGRKQPRQRKNHYQPQQACESSQAVLLNRPLSLMATRYLRNILVLSRCLV